MINSEFKGSISNRKFSITRDQCTTEEIFLLQTHTLGAIIQPCCRTEQEVVK